MKKILVVLFVVLMLLMSGVGCTPDQADTVNYNLTKEADNFNVTRQITVMNNVTGDVLFQMTGLMSIEHDGPDNQLEVIVEMSEGQYAKHFIGLNEVTTYVVEDLGENEIDKYNYTLRYNPKMWLPIDVEKID